MAHSKKFNRSNKANKRRMNKTKNKKKRTKNKSNKRNMLRKKFSLKKQKKKNKNLRGGALHSEITGLTGPMGPKGAPEKNMLLSPPLSPLSQSSPLSFSQSHFKPPSKGKLSRTVSDKSALTSNKTQKPPTLNNAQLKALQDIGNPEEVIKMMKREQYLKNEQNRLNMKYSFERTRSVPPGMGLG